MYSYISSSKHELLHINHIRLSPLYISLSVSLESSKGIFFTPKLFWGIFLSFFWYVYLVLITCLYHEKQQMVSEVLLCQTSGSVGKLVSSCFPFLLWVERAEINGCLKELYTWSYEILKHPVRAGPGTNMERPPIFYKTVMHFKQTWQVNIALLVQNERMEG